jgi:hypothetical protein
MPGMEGVDFLELAIDLSPGRQARPAHGLRRHAGGDQGDQRHLARLLPEQAVGPAGGPPLPRRRRAPARLGGRGRIGGAAARRPGRRAPLLRRVARDPRLPRAQPRRLPLARHQPRSRGPRCCWPRGPTTRSSRGRLRGRLVPARCRAPSQVAEKVGLQTHAQTDFYDLVIVGRRPAGPGAAVYGRVGGASRPCSSSGRPRAARPGRARGSRTTSGSRRACRARTSPEAPRPRRSGSGAEVLTVREIASIEARGPARVVTMTDGHGALGPRGAHRHGVSWRKLDVPGAGELAGRGGLLRRGAVRGDLVQGRGGLRRRGCELRGPGRGCTSRSTPRR